MEKEASTVVQLSIELSPELMKRVDSDELSEIMKSATQKSTVGPKKVKVKVSQRG